MSILQYLFADHTELGSAPSSLSSDFVMLILITNKHSWNMYNMYVDMCVYAYYIYTHVYMYDVG